MADVSDAEFPHETTSNRGVHVLRRPRRLHHDSRLEENCSYAPLARSLRKVNYEETFHVSHMNAGHGSSGTIRRKPQARAGNSGFTPLTLGSACRMPAKQGRISWHIAFVARRTTKCARNGCRAWYPFSESAGIKAAHFGEETYVLTMSRRSTSTKKSGNGITTADHLGRATQDLKKGSKQCHDCPRSRKNGARISGKSLSLIHAAGAPPPESNRYDRSDNLAVKEDVVEALEAVHDPHVPVSLRRMGMLREWTCRRRRGYRAGLYSPYGVPWGRHVARKWPRSGTDAAGRHQGRG